MTYAVEAPFPSSSPLVCISLSLASPEPPPSALGLGYPPHHGALGSPRSHHCILLLQYPSAHPTLITHWSPESTTHPALLPLSLFSPSLLLCRGQRPEHIADGIPDHPSPCETTFASSHWTPTGLSALAMYAILILTFLIPLAGSAVINTSPASRPEDSLTSYPSANITNLETLIQNGPRTSLRSKGPHCLQSMGTPPLHSCMEALSLLPKDGQQVTFGQRRSRGLVDHVMPFDLISCKSMPLTDYSIPAHEPWSYCFVI